VIILNGCNIDKHNPFLREWSILALRNLTEENEENQKFISELVPEGVPTNVQEDMNEIGVDVQLTEEGSVKLKKQ
jgi:ataxin-10